VGLALVLSYSAKLCEKKGLWVLAEVRKEAAESRRETAEQQNIEYRLLKFMFPTPCISVSPWQPGKLAAGRWKMVDGVDA
jgi:hypothetical protein